MEFKVGELVKSKQTGFIYKVRDIGTAGLVLHRPQTGTAWYPSHGKAQRTLSKIEPTKCPIVSPEIKPPLKAKHSELCILCQANPARSCDCNKPKPKVKVDSRFVEEQPIVLRQGWDNITNCGLPGYLHMNSDTTIYVASYGSNSRWRWESKFDTNGRQQIEHADTALALMKQVEDYLKQSN